MSDAMRTCRYVSAATFVGTLRGVMLTLQLEPPSANPSTNWPKTGPKVKLSVHPLVSMAQVELRKMKALLSFHFVKGSQGAPSSKVARKSMAGCASGVTSTYARAMGL